MSAREMICERSQRELHALVDDELGAGIRARLARHLARVPRRERPAASLTSGGDSASGAGSSGVRGKKRVATTGRGERELGRAPAAGRAATGAVANCPGTRCLPGVEHLTPRKREFLLKRAAVSARSQA
jgi:anti-sigma factor RsiW